MNGTFGTMEPNDPDPSLVLTVGNDDNLGNNRYESCTLYVQRVRRAVRECRELHAGR
ncbi:MAG: hypothetical protein R3F28_03300 [Candidatus Kapaibacterium sp.]